MQTQPVYECLINRSNVLLDFIQNIFQAQVSSQVQFVVMGHIMFVVRFLKELLPQL